MPGRDATRLTVAERAALLRAARDRLQILEHDLQLWDRRVAENSVPSAKAMRDIAHDEWLLLSEAIRKTWLGVASDG